MRWLLVTTSLLIALASGWWGSVSARPHDSGPCCIDRWDPNWTDRGMWGHRKGMGAGNGRSMERHWAFMHSGAPDGYRGQTNPHPPTPANVERGGALYRQHCAACHGPRGMGDGEAGRSLNPSPALLAYFIQRPVYVDEYLMWSIAEGGRSFGTAMPAFKDTLAPDDIWRIVTFMRAGFPPHE